MKRLLLFPLMLMACREAIPRRDTPGDKLEAVAVARGLVADPDKAGLQGSWASETDRLCVVPGAGPARLGASVDYGEGQTCAASGTVERAGDKLDVRFGACRFDARFEGDRIVFPPELPDACERLCQGRASLAALAVERLSESASEATTLKGAGGQPLCAAN